MLLASSILLILMDDVGTDKAASVCTPTLDALASAGLTFTRAYANPLCVPTRASLMTGRYPFRSGLGSGTGLEGLALSEVTFPELIDLPNTMVGKWHLKGALPPDTHPNQQGWDSYRGHLGGQPESYTSWSRTVDGVTNTSFTYATTQNAIDLLQTLPSPPFLAYVAFNACHGPHTAPPTCPPNACICGASANPEEHYEAMLEEMDRTIGVIYRALVRETGGDLITIVLGDNGTTRAFADPCPRGGKSHVTEGGVNVPMIVQGPGVVRGTTDALVHVVDLFATLCDLTNTAVPTGVAEDSVSFVPVLGGAPGAREWVYCERFSPPGLPLAITTDHDRCVVESRWKLIRYNDGRPDRLYDLENDPCEARNLLFGPLSAEGRAAYFRLEDRLHLLGV